MLCVYVIAPLDAQVGESDKRTWPDAPRDTIQANGHWNKEVLTVIPSLRMVVAARGNWGRFQPGRAEDEAEQRLKLLKEAVIRSPAETLW
jgi:hypothetical protein